jgi:hypothetical protein
MKVAFNLLKVLKVFISSTNKMFKNTRDTKIHKITEGIRKTQQLWVF